MTMQEMVPAVFLPEHASTTSRSTNGCPLSPSMPFRLKEIP